MRFLTTMALAALCAVQAAHAHFIYLELPPDEPEAVHMRFGHEPLEATNKRMQRLIETTEVRTSTGERVEMALGEEALGGAAPGDTPAAGASLLYGVLDRGEDGAGVFLLNYHAKAARDAGSASSVLDLPLEVVGDLQGDTLHLTVLWDGEPVPEAEVWMVGPGLLDPRTVTADAQGAVDLPLPQSGWVGIRVMKQVDEAGTHEDAPYEFVRHYSTLSFRHEAEAR